MMMDRQESMAMHGIVMMLAINAIVTGMVDGEKLRLDVLRVLNIHLKDYEIQIKMSTITRRGLRR